MKIRSFMRRVAVVVFTAIPATGILIFQWLEENPDAWYNFVAEFKKEEDENE